MKYVSVIFFILSLCDTNVQAQNYVPNGNFEQYSTCPINNGQINYCNGWAAYTTSYVHYFHTCGSNGFGIPSLNNGFQHPASGNAFIGLVTYAQYYNVKAYAHKSILPLQQGCIYEVSMSVSPADEMKWRTDDLGIFFFDNGQPFVNTTAPLQVTPQVNYYNYGPILDTINWTRLTATFTADSTYDNIVIGGFKDSGVVIKTFNPKGTYPTSFYYIDSVVIRPLKVNLTFGDTFLCQNEIITVPYTVLPCANYNLGNVFRLQLSDANGSFVNPVNIGSITSTTSGNIQGTIPYNAPTGLGYRLRIISTNAVDSSLDNGFNIVIGTPVKAVSNTPVCEGDALTIDAVDALPGTTFNWTGPMFTSMQQYNAFPTAIPSNSGKYIVTATYKGCDAKDSVVVVVKPLPVITPGNNSPICPGETLQLNAGGSYPNATYNWSGPAFSSSDKNPAVPSANKINAGTYTVSATINGCTSLPASTEVLIKDIPSPPQVTDTTVCRYASPVVISVAEDSIKWYNNSSGTGSFSQPEILTSDTIPVTLFATQIVNGCESEKAKLTIRIKDVPIFELGDNKAICTGDSITIGLAKENVTYNWNTGSNACCITVKEDGVYTQSMTNVCGTKSDEIAVTVSPCAKCVYVASAFTPNNDGINDVFGASSICTIQEFRMKIYNRWSDLVFQSDNINNKWDGRIKGKDARMDTYYYYIEYTAELPTKIERKILLKGDVTLVR